MFKKILIANRGEVALRIIYACRELGIKTVAVYSEADENSLHVRFADEDVCIGPARSADSYLNVPAVISAAEITGADAIHPGYGFLSESAYLAEVCEACHIKFIGPDPQVIRLMGDKARARRVMKKAGVPILPGSDGPIESEEKALKIAKDIGYPVIIKATAGGGGRGMRVVRTASRAAARVQDGAARSRGGVRRRRRVHREVRRVAAAHRVPDPRRSARQRRASRRARVLDSAPAPEAASKNRRRRRSARRCAARWARVVIDAAKAVQYTNAGTFEFLMDPTGISTSWKRTRACRSSIRSPRWSPASTSSRSRFASPPASGCRSSRATSPSPAMRSSAASTPRIRTRSCRRRASSTRSACRAARASASRRSRTPTAPISPYYDSMIAKIIVHGRDRQEAIARMRRTLEMTVDRRHQDHAFRCTCGSSHDPDFVAGKLSTRVHGTLPRASPVPGRSPKRSDVVPSQPSAEAVPSLGLVIPAVLSLPLAQRHLRRRAARARGLDARRSRRACLDGGATFLQLRAKAARRAAGCSDVAERIVDLRAPTGAPSSSTTAPTSRGWPAPPACTSARTISRRRPSGVSSAADAIVGLSTHTTAQIDAAVRAAGRLRGDRPGLRHRTKDTGYDAVGLDAGASRPRRARVGTRLPLVAIGGITLERAAEVIGAGADRSR